MSAFEEAVPFPQTEQVQKPVKAPFIPERIPIFDKTIADFLTEVIPGMGATPPPPVTAIPVAVEEQYEVAERKAVSTSTTPVYYDVLTVDPKQILLIAETQDHFVEFNSQISADSPKIFASGSMSLTAKGITRIWMQAVTGTGTIRILVFKR
jgi:hypothetical protein